MECINFVKYVKAEPLLNALIEHVITFYNTVLKVTHHDMENKNKKYCKIQNSPSTITVI